MKEIKVRRDKRGHVIDLFDHVSPDELSIRLDRLCDAHKKKKAAYLADDDSFCTEDDLTSLGLPVLARIPSLACFSTIPPLPTAEAIIAAWTDSDEITGLIRRAKETARREEGEI